MQKLQESYIFSGMQRDLSVSKHPSQFLYDAHNVRLTARGDNTLLSITNEKSPKNTEISVLGVCVGHCLLNKYLVVFTAIPNYAISYIYRIDLSSLDSKVLFKGDLGFNSDYPIDAITSYENENVQKVYWVDGLHQPRVINIVDSRIEERTSEDSYYPFNLDIFNFIPTLELNEKVKVKKVLGSGGEFAPGVIQYAFTYYYKYGQETNIFYTTPLLYISYRDRGASPEDKVDNVFQINVQDVDTKFDYLRIYSIQRTSINATPICKRVQDIALEGITGNKISFTDTGTIGDSIDPTELLYKGGEIIAAKTLEQKDNTLFLGNLSITRNPISGDLKESIKSHMRETKNLLATESVRTFKPTLVSRADYIYYNQLTSYDVDDTERSVPCSGFKKGNYYRLGVQFQHESGKWSEPIYIKNLKGEYRFSEDNNGNIAVPGFTGNISKALEVDLLGLGYRKVRPLVVLPTMQDRDVLCQGVVNPTMKNGENSIYQSSWFFRPNLHSSLNYVNSNGTTSPFADVAKLPYTDKKVGDVNTSPSTSGWNPIPTTEQLKYHIRMTEIQGDYNPEDRFAVDSSLVSFHSPDVEFDERFMLMDFQGLSCRRTGYASFTKTFSDIEIQTTSPQISNSGSGFVHENFVSDYSYGIGAGLFYDDMLVDELVDSGEFLRWDKQREACKWLIYPWQGNGSLNNDVQREADKGVQSAELKKKVISNLRYAKTIQNERESSYDLGISDTVSFSSNEVQIIKVDSKMYEGNVDTLLNSNNADGDYFAYEGYEANSADTFGRYRHISKETPFTSNDWWKTYSKDVNSADTNGIWKYWSAGKCWVRRLFEEGTSDLGDRFVDLLMKKKPVRMKYKSTPHLVIATYYTSLRSYDYNSSLPIIDIVRNEAPTNRFGGESMDALKANVWIPAGEPVMLSSTEDKPIKWEYGDTYYQRWDCLKTYPFTREDPNQIVEIGSFMLETHVNIDGRYDRNRGQVNNLNMSPQNFNLLNPVYSQQDNFFQYRILDDDYYENTAFPNQVTWTKEKQSGADVDLWTNITLASTYDIDGSKGAVKSLNFWRNDIYCFQDRGISKLLFNSRVQIPASDGVPIEISNNYKMDGYVYLSDGVGCKNAHLIKETPAGIYFIDSVTGHLFQIGDGLQDITEKCNMTTWFKEYTQDFTRLMYDDVNHDVYMVNEVNNPVMCFSEKLGQFAGTFNYFNMRLIESYNQRVFALNSVTTRPGYQTMGHLWTMFEGDDYCRFFNGYTSPWSVTLVSNGISNNLTLADKTYTNLEFRASVEGDGVLDSNTGKFTPTLPLTDIDAWNGYQRGIATLKNLTEHAAMTHHSTTTSEASLKRKFRIWRCDIPRNNAPLSGDSSYVGLYRKERKPLDRLRSTWLYLTLKNYDNASVGTELHDIQVTYYV